MMLTVDANGNDATSPDFDAENIVQFGYTDQWPDDFRSICNSFGAASMVDADGNAVWPEGYQPCLEWMYNGMWTDNFYPNAAWEGSELLSTPNAFGSGNIAMALTHLWFTCCIEGAPVDNWDLAVLPTNADGTTTSKLHADTYRILDSTENPEAAFEVLTYLIGEASPQLTLTYGALPIRENEQAAYFEAQDARYPQGVDWSIVNKMLEYPDIPSHEQALPNNNQARDRLLAFVSLLKSDGTLDLGAEVDTLVSDLQAIYDAAP
jgi:multiple sugar transport system substrate-binding protein